VINDLRGSLANVASVHAAVAVGLDAVEPGSVLVDVTDVSPGPLSFINVGGVLPVTWQEPIDDIISCSHSYKSVGRNT